MSRSVLVRVIKVRVKKTLEDGKYFILVLYSVEKKVYIINTKYTVLTIEFLKKTLARARFKRMNSKIQKECIPNGSKGM